MVADPALPMQRAHRMTSYGFLAAGCILFGTSFFIGIDDNPPGVAFLLVGLFAIVLGVVHRFGRSGQRTPAQQLLYWAPRALCIGYAAFIGLLALDVFHEGQGFRATSLALLMHLIPTAVILAVLTVSWRSEWIAGVLYSGLAVLYVMWAWHKPFAVWSTLLLVAGPLVLTGALFLINWYYRRELRGSST